MFRADLSPTRKRPRAARLPLAAALALALSVFGALDRPAAAAPACGETHTIEQGETLLSLAKEVYGSESAWARIYEYRDNAAWIGTDALAPPPGAFVVLPPCPFRDVLFEQPLGFPPKVDPPKDAELGPPVEILVNDRADFFMSKSLPRFGLLYQMAQAAFLASDMKSNPRFLFIKDPISHTTALLRHRVFQLGVAWARPNCNFPELWEAAGGVCDYHFSRPIYSVAIALYGRRDAASDPETVYDLRGAKICRRAGEETYDFVENDLKPGENFELVTASSPTDCLQMLRDGAVDYVMMDRFEAEIAANRRDFREHVKLLPRVIAVRTLHLVSTPLPDGSRHPLLDAFDQGLERLRANGLEDEIIAWHLARHRAILIR